MGPTEQTFLAKDCTNLQKGEQTGIIFQASELRFEPSTF